MHTCTYTNIKGFITSHNIIFIVYITGHAHIAYIPENKVIGLSKINRLVDYYAHRPQVQERLSLQILKELQDTLETENVIVMICAKHLCVSSRGIKDKSSFTSTTEYSGCFEKEQERANFFKIIESASAKNN